MRSLFNATDDCLAPYIGLEEFEESLLLNVLFQETTIVSETHFFNSTLLSRHVVAARGRSSLFEAAARESIIIPAFRDKDVVLLHESRARMKEYYGEKFEVVNPAAEVPLDRIISAVDGGREISSPAYWPSHENYHLGESYEKLIRDLVQTDRPPEFSTDLGRVQIFQRVWEGSKRWRYDCVEEAIGQTRRKGAKGLQRLELMNAIGRRFAVSSQTDNVLPLHILAKCSREKRLVLEIFLKWITQIHQLNHARAFESAVNFPVYNLQEDFILDSIHRSPADPAPAKEESFRCLVDLPPLSLLLKSAPKELIHIRRDIGNAYFDALRRWHVDPKEAAREEVERLLKQYCNQICEAYNSSIRQPLLATVAKGDPKIEMLRDTILSLISGGTSGLFVQAWKGMRTFYRFVRKKQMLKATAPRSRNLEITHPSAPFWISSET